MSYPKWLIFLTINLAIVNVGLVYLYFFSSPDPVDTCGPNCQQYIASQIDSIKTVDKMTQQITQIPTKTPVPSPIKQDKISSNKQVSYIPVPGSGSLLSYTWADLPGTDFYFNPADFPGLTDVRFEANMKLLNGNGLAFLRLFDVTHGIEVWGSDVQTASQPATVVVSQNVQFRPGNNLIRVQAKSLTADTTVFISGRLKITTN